MSGGIDASIRRDRLCLVGIALVVNDAVPFRFPTELDSGNLAQLVSCPFLAQEMNSDRMRRARSQFWRLSQATFAEMFLPPNLEDLYGDNLEIVVDNLRLVCFPLKAAAKVRNSPLVSFSVVVALDASYDIVVEYSRARLKTEPTPTSYGEAYPLSLAGIRPYRTIARDLARALLYAENFQGFVSHATKRALEENCSTTDVQEELKRIYVGLVEAGTADLRVRGKSLCASFNLYDPRLRPTMGIRPYHSVLIDQDQSADALDTTPAKEFTAYFRQWGAIKSLADAADDLGISLEQACHLAAYIRQWSRARVVHKLQDASMFYVTPGCNLRRNTNPAFLKFTQRFPGHDLAKVLSRVTEPKPGTRIPRRLKEFNEVFGEQTKPIFSWLMRHKFVIEVFQFVYFVPGMSSRAGSRRSSVTAMTEPPSPTSAMGPFASNSLAPTPPPSGAHIMPTTPSASSSNPLVGTVNQKPSPSAKTMAENLLEGKTLTASQLSYLKSVWDLNNPLFRMFLKLCPLFGGTNHLQEIVFRTGVSVGALKMVLEQYSDSLFIAIHELSS